jgi:hypothetical protein
MLNLERIEIRVRQLLDDSDGTRFNENLVENAIRQALNRMDEQVPQVCTIEKTVTGSGKEQVLDGLHSPLYILEAMIVSAQQKKTALEFTYTLSGESACLNFGEKRYPLQGETLKVTYACANTLSGLDEATVTSLPHGAEITLEFFAAGLACLLRSAAMAEAYGARPGESTRLVEQSRLWMEAAEKSMAGCKNLQTFGFPPGFALDSWERKGGAK